LSSQQNDARIKALETRVARLADFNQLLLNHLMRAQTFSPGGKGPTPQNVNRWVIELSNAVWNTYRNSPKL
jgi:hypothetical protein